jgi:hypothetical protein
MSRLPIQSNPPISIKSIDIGQYPISTKVYSSNGDQPLTGTTLKDVYNYSGLTGSTNGIVKMTDFLNYQYCIVYGEWWHDNATLLVSGVTIDFMGYLPFTYDITNNLIDEIYFEIEFKLKEDNKLTLNFKSEDESGVYNHISGFFDEGGNVWEDTFDVEINSGTTTPPTEGYVITYRGTDFVPNIIRFKLNIENDFNNKLYLNCVHGDDDPETEEGFTKKKVLQHLKGL